MKKVLVLLALLITGLMFSTPAQAAPGPIGQTQYQKICNSGATPSDISIQYGTTYAYEIRPENCKSLLSGTLLQIQARSFRVAYDYGDYRSCQNIAYTGGGYSKTFVPSSSPDVIYFKMYNRADCRN